MCALTDLDNVEGISVDWIGNNLYWTNDGYRKTISVARLERASETRKTLLEGDMSHPRAIVVDPLNRYSRENSCYIITILNVGFTTNPKLILYSDLKCQSTFIYS